MAKQQNKSTGTSIKRGGIGKDVQASNRIEFKISKENPFVIAKLTDVTTGFTEKEENPYLLFIFTDEKGVQSLYHYESLIDEEINSKSGKTYTIEDLNASQDQRIAHIYNAYMGNEAHAKANDGEGLGAGVWDDNKSLKENTKAYFDKIVEDFNTGRDGKPVYQDKNDNPIYTWLRLTYGSGNKLQFPLFPNFIDRAEQGRPTYLRPNSTDTYEPTKRKSKRGTISVDEPDNVSTGGTSDLPPGFIQ